MEDLSRVYLEMYEGYEPMTPERQGKVDRQVQKAHRDENLAVGKGDEAGANKQMQRRIAMQSRQKMRTEDLDLYDLILDYLLDEGFCDDEEAATVIMTHMSEDWREEILDEAVKGAKKGTIRSVIEKGGKSIKYVQSGGDIVAGDRSADLRASSAEGKKVWKNAGNQVRVNRANSGAIERLNAIDNVEVRHGHNDTGDFTSYNSRSGYREVPTDYRARKRRASGK